MTDQEFKDSVCNAMSFMHRAMGPELYFWQGYLRGLRLHHNDEEFETDLWSSINSHDNDLESQGYRLGLAGKTAQEALAIGKQGKYLAGFNRNYHKDIEDGYLEKMGVLYHGSGKWTLPKGAKILLGEREPGLFLGVRDGDNWVLKLADGNEWVVWSEDIPGIIGPPWDS